MKRQYLPTLHSGPNTREATVVESSLLWTYPASISLCAQYDWLFTFEVF